MNYVYGKGILLRSIIGIGLVLSLATSTTVYCMLGEDKKPSNEIAEGYIRVMDSIKNEVKNAERDYQDILDQFFQERQPKANEVPSQLKPLMLNVESTEQDKAQIEIIHTLLNNMCRRIENMYKELGRTEEKKDGRQEAIEEIHRYINSIDPKLFSSDQNGIGDKVVNGGGTPPQVNISRYDTPTIPNPELMTTYDVPRPIYDTPRIEEGINISRYDTPTTPNPELITTYDVPKPIYDTPRTEEGINNYNGPQPESDENIYASMDGNTDPLSVQGHSRKKRSTQYAPDAKDRDNGGAHNLEHDDSNIYEDIDDTRYDNREAYAVPAGLNDDSNYYSLNQDDHAAKKEDHDVHDDSNIYEDIDDTRYDNREAYAVPAGLNDDSNYYSLNQDDHAAKKEDHDVHDDSNIYEDIDDTRYDNREAYAVPAGLNNDSNDYSLNQDDHAAKEEDPDIHDDSADPMNSQADNNKHTQYANNVITSTTNADDKSANNDANMEWNDNGADDNNQLSNIHNQDDTKSYSRKSIAYGDHVIFSQLFDLANYTALQRLSSRLTAYALNQAVNGQFRSQKLVSSGSTISNVQNEIWIMPLIKKGEKYSDSMSKYMISTSGINIGFDSKIPHYRCNTESVLGVVFALYNSQLEHTASDSATLLSTYIISMYYSIIFNQKFFIYTLFSLGTSNASSNDYATGINNTTLHKLVPFSTYNVFRQSAEMQAGYNIMMYDNRLDDQQIILLPMAGIQFDTVSLHTDATKYYCSLQQLKLSTGIKIAHHKRIKSSVSVNSALYGFVNYCPWSNAMIYNDQSLMSNLGNSTLIEKESLAACNNKLYYRIGGEASLQYKRIMYSLRYEMNIAQDYLSHQIALKIKLKL